MAIFWLVLLLAGSLTCLAQAQREPGRLRELESIRRQIASLRVQLSRIDDETSGLEAELRRTEIEVRLQERQVEEAQAERSIAEAAMHASEVRAEALEAALTAARQGLQTRMSSLYRRGERDLLRSFLSPGDSKSTLEEMRLVRLLARRDAFWVGKYRVARRNLELEREVLAANQAEVEVTTARERERLRRLARTRTLQRRALDLMEARRQGVAQQTVALVDKEEKLSLLVSILSGREVELPDGVAIQSFEGALDWPVRGEVLQGFGLRSEERYRTKIPHNGVEIATVPETDIRVVFPGVVVFSSPFEDFGLTVVVHHPDGVFSLYAGLEAVSVAKGDVVSFSDVLGAARDSVYFEIRVDNRPQDPLTWLR
jgi:septal ring factor EnvC (AmiA/AmiB activator)